MGYGVSRETFEENGDVIGVAQWIQKKVRGFGVYGFCPKGPIILPERRSAISRSKSKGEMFLRIEPDHLDSFPSARKTINVSPADTLITDLSSSEDDLLAAMHPKTRYNIGVAKRHGVEIDFDSKDFDSIWNLFCETSARGGFRLHSKRYYQTMLDTLRNSGCHVFSPIAQKTCRVLAANIVVDFGDTRTYLHGASSNQDRNSMAPYLLHWELMRDAKALGLRFYDWWGVAPSDSPAGHPWTGISRFKRGFGGKEVSAPGTYDVILKPTTYYLYQSIRSVVRAVRRAV